MGSAISQSIRTGSASDNPSSSCPPFQLRQFANGSLKSTSISLGRWIIYEDPGTNQLRFAWGDRDWCLAFDSSGKIQIQQGNKLEGTSCWTGDACTSSTWCTSYQDPVKKNWYKGCRFPSVPQIREREEKLGIGPDNRKVVYMDRLTITDPLSGKNIELYEDYTQYSLVKKQDDAKLSRPQLVMAYDKKPVWVIDPTSLNERATGTENSRGLKLPNLGGFTYHSFNNSSNPHYLGVLSTEGHTARADDTGYAMSSVPKLYKAAKTTDKVTTVEMCSLGLRVSLKWSIRTALDPSRPGTLWFTYNADISDTKTYSKAVGLDVRRGDVYEEFDGDIVRSSEDFGHYISCPPGYAVVRFCGSGKDHNCGGSNGFGRLSMDQQNRGVTPVAQILCRGLDRIASARAPIGVSMKNGTPKITSTWSMHNEWTRKCPPNALLTGVCVSGENSDCPKAGPNGSIVDSNSRFRGAIQCSSYGSGSSAVKVNPDQNLKVKGYFTTPLVPKGTAAMGVCNGGRNASDCDGNVFGTLVYSKVTIPKSVSPVTPAGYLLASTSTAEQKRVRAALGAPSTTRFADQRGWCNDPREKCNPALGTTVEYQPWEKRINVYETSDATKVKLVTDPNRTIWRYNGAGKALTKLGSSSSSSLSSNAQYSTTPNSGSLSAPQNILKQMRPGWYLGNKAGTVQARITQFAWKTGDAKASITLSASLRAGNYRIYNSSKQNTGFDSNYTSLRVA